jgi:hypothetical protein
MNGRECKRIGEYCGKGVRPLPEHHDNTEISSAKLLDLVRKTGINQMNLPETEKG